MTSLSTTSPIQAAFDHIPWDNLASLKLTAQETALLRMADTNEISYTLGDSRDASMYARVLLKLVQEANQQQQGVVANVTGDDKEALEALDQDPLGVVCHYAVSKVYQILEALEASDASIGVAAVFYVHKEGTLVEQWKALLRLLNKSGPGDAYLQKMASLCLAKILLAACPSQATSRSVSYESAKEPVEALTAWMVSQLKNHSQVSTAALRVWVKAAETRHCFAMNSGIKYLAKQLAAGGKGIKRGGSSNDSNKASVQQLYELTFCLWILTYDASTNDALRHELAQAVPALVEMVAVAPREKVVRVALSSLRNLATLQDIPDKTDAQFFLTEMMAHGALRALDYLRDRQFTDEDLQEDITVLYKLLHDNYREMSRWDVYQAEVESGALAWGSCHTEAFFKENAKLMEGSDGDFRLLKLLIAILSQSGQDEDVQAVACYDIGEFVRHYPNGRAIAKRLGAKEIVMPLIEHENVELQRHALQCVSKIMVQNWEHVK